MTTYVALLRGINDKRLGVTTTNRNWKTTMKLLELATRDK